MSYRELVSTLSKDLLPSLMGEDGTKCQMMYALGLNAFQFSRKTLII